MRLIQFETSDEKRRVGIIEGERALDLTATLPECPRILDLFFASRRAGVSLAAFVRQHLDQGKRPTEFSYPELLASPPRSGRAFLRPPLDHPDPYHLLISGTGLTHTGSMQARDDMHTVPDSDAPKSDSAKMFEMGLSGGKPEPGRRGAAPEWFYKGNGAVLRGHREWLDIPAFALGAGEEPEIVGCYVIDEAGIPCRLGFALGNDWSDHATERINYLYLAPSKLRTCAVGPELNLDCDFQSIRLRCKVTRQTETLYDSDWLASGERHMCHSLANCEDHHFKYPQHRLPGAVHLHFFGTSKLSYGSRNWEYQTGDEIEVAAPEFSASLVNSVRQLPGEAAQPVAVAVM
ncbi:MAG TPA: AraD1 family protein [Gemmataceae bacterium]|jgi:hypothetical protein|nr:AraD1 family protein [Gemmataceae bacterium]